ncbi:histidine phosphatase family protein [Peptacetobacter hiranonis]|uniref:histidine phosphatase family protein n=1 Tax=Peptacetobacter hiranonis TaxID=89152 RepID=UPI003D816CAC
MKRLVLIRHASTVANENGLLCGSMETDISEKGRLEIDCLKERIERLKKEENWKLSKVYVSESKRTEETVKDIENLEIIKIKDLGEIDFGDFEGKTFEWIKNEYPKEYDKLCTEGFDYRYPNGENAIEAYEKNKRAIEYILEDMEDDSTAIICAHSGSIRNILSYMLCGKLENHWNFKIENAKITVLEYDYGFSVLTKLNY